MLGQVVDKLDAWVGRAFLLSCYVPCLVFAVLNLLLACVERQGLREFLVSEQGALTSTKTYDVLLALLGIAVLAFALSPVLRFVTLLLEGEGLPAWIAEPMLLLHAREREALARVGQAVETRRSRLPSEDWVEAFLKESRDAGLKLGRIGNALAIDRAAAEIRTLQAYRLLNRPIDGGTFIAALAALSEALRSNCADLEGLALPVSEDDMKKAIALDSLHVDVFTVLAHYVIDIAERSEAREWDRRSRLFAVSELAPTRLGNEAAELRSYCETRYGLEFDFFWPRLQLVIQKDDKLSAALVRSKIQVDFSIVCLSLTLLSGLGWLVAILCVGHNPLTLLLIAGVAPPMAFAWLRIVHASYADFSQLVRSAVDLSRRELLRQLSLQPPATLDEERALWLTLGRWLIFDEEPDALSFGEKAKT